MCIIVHVCVGVYTYVSVCTCGYVRVHLCLYVCSVVWYSDPDPLREIQSCAHYGPDTQAVRRPTHGTIWRPVLVRTVKTIRRFGFKIVSFYVSVCSYVFSYLLLLVDVYVPIHIISCDYLIYFTSMITRITS